MDSKISTEQTLCVEINEHEYKLKIPRNSPLIDGYRAVIAMANIFNENMIKEQKEIEAMIPEEPKEAMSEEEVVEPEIVEEVTV